MTYLYRYDADGNPSSELVYYHDINHEDNERLNLAARSYDLIGPQLEAVGGVFTVNFQGKSLEARVDKNYCIHLQLAGKTITLGQLAKADLDLLFGMLSRQ